MKKSSVAEKVRKGAKITKKAVANYQKVTKKTIKDEALKIAAQAIKHKAANCESADWPAECLVQITLTVADCRKILKAAALS